MFSYQSVWKAFQVAATKAGLNKEGGNGRKLPIHDLRRTYASILLNDGQLAPFRRQATRPHGGRPIQNVCRADREPGGAASGAAARSGRVLPIGYFVVRALTYG